MKLLEIYGQTGCGYCVKAKAYAEAHNIPHVYRDIADQSLRAEMFARFPQAATVPQIFVGERHIGGHDDLVAIQIPHLQQMIGE